MNTAIRTHTLNALGRSRTTAAMVLANNRKPVSEMDDDQRKAVMAKMRGGGGGPFGGYARGGGSPARRTEARFRRLAHDMEMAAQGRRGLTSDLTPLDMVIGTGIEEGIDSIASARENTDNTIAQAALGIAGLALFAAGIKTALKKGKAMDDAAALASRAAVHRQMATLAEDAARFRGAPTDEIAAAAAKADRLYIQADKLDALVRAAQADDFASPLLSYRPKPTTAGDDLMSTVRRDMNTMTPAQFEDAYPRVQALAEIPRSPTGDLFRDEAAKNLGSMRGMYLDYARRADVEAVAPRSVRDPWTTTGDAIAKMDLSPPALSSWKKPTTDFGEAIPPLPKPANFGDKAWNTTMKRTAERLSLDLSDTATAGKLNKALEKVRGEFWRLNPDLSIKAKPLSKAAQRRVDLEEAARLTPDRPASEFGYLSKLSVRDLVDAQKREATDYARQKASAVAKGKKLKPGETLDLYGNRHPGLRLIANAITVARATDTVIANAGPLNDAQRRAMFAKSGFSVAAKSRTRSPDSPGKRISAYEDATGQKYTGGRPAVDQSGRGPGQLIPNPSPALKRFMDDVKDAMMAGSGTMYREGFAGPGGLWIPNPEYRTPGIVTQPVVRDNQQSPVYALREKTRAPRQGKMPAPTTPTRDQLPDKQPFIPSPENGYGGLIPPVYGPRPGDPRFMRPGGDMVPIPGYQRPDPYGPMKPAAKAKNAAKASAKAVGKPISARGVLNLIRKARA